MRERKCITVDVFWNDNVQIKNPRAQNRELRGFWENRVFLTFPHEKTTFQWPKVVSEAIFPTNSHCMFLTLVNLNLQHRKWKKLCQRLVKTLKLKAKIIPLMFCPLPSPSVFVLPFLFYTNKNKTKKHFPITTPLITINAVPNICLVVCTKGIPICAFKYISSLWIAIVQIKFVCMFSLKAIGFTGRVLKLCSSGVRKILVY